MNSTDNISQTIQTLDSSIRLLHDHAKILAPLSVHNSYGERVTDILNKIQIQHNEIIGITNEVLTNYEDRYSKQMEEVDDLTALLKEELNGK